mgnify:FL=1|tara:strand:- start:298 stop:579 length:282 start_codon:yes stop_codon:yes gene_type:complete
MAFSSTIDTRPHTIGDLIVFTGTYNAAGAATGTIDLSEMCTSILSATLNNDTFGDVTGGGVDGDFAIIPSGTATIVVDCISGNTGKWFAICHR